MIRVYDNLPQCVLLFNMRRFRLRLEVFDGVESAIFVLRDPHAEQLTGFTCEELLNSIAVRLVV